MKLLIDIPDSKANAVFEVLKSIPQIKVKLLSEQKAQLLIEIKDATDQLKSIRHEKEDERNPKDSLNE